MTASRSFLRRGRISSWKNGVKVILRKFPDPKSPAKAPAMHPWIPVLSLVAVSEGFVLRPLSYRVRTRIDGGGGGDGSDDTEPEFSETWGSAEGASGDSLLSRMNELLDQPLLDANIRSDEGPVKEALKSFVRDDPTIASVAFSVAATAFFVLLIRLVNSF